MERQTEQQGSAQQTDALRRGDVETNNMDKTAYCEHVLAQLRSLQAYVNTLQFPQPSTLEASVHQRSAKDKAEKLRQLMRELVLKVEAAKSRSAETWDADRQDLDHRWQQVETLRKFLQ
jgi:DNA-binding FrmR family transcriptional regulator